MREIISYTKEYTLLLALIFINFEQVLSEEDIEVAYIGTLAHILYTNMRKRI